MEKWCKIPQNVVGAFWDIFQATLVAASTGIAAFFDSTYTYLIALFIGFVFNILAGFRADEVKVKIKRIFPPVLAFEKFSGNKFKDSLMELALIFTVTYILKGLFDLMNYENSSSVVVQYLTWIALYYYLRNGLRNLSKVYPKVKWIRMLYNLIAFKLKEMFGADISEIVTDEEKKDDAEKNSNN